jgi:hypothetical protein
MGSSTTADRGPRKCWCQETSAEVTGGGEAGVKLLPPGWRLAIDPWKLQQSGSLHRFRCPGGVVYHEATRMTTSTAEAFAQDRQPRFLHAVTLILFLAAASVPTPLYRLYQREWGFSPLMLTVIFAVN